MAESRRRAVERARSPVWGLTAAMAAVGLALGLTTLRHWGPVVEPPAVVLPWIALTALFALAELCVVSVQFQQEATTFSLGEVPLVLGLVLVSPSRLLTAQLAACAAVLVLHRHQELRKTLFNLAKWGVETEVAIVTFRAVLQHGDPFSPRGWLAAGGAPGGGAPLPPAPPPPPPPP